MSSNKFVLTSGDDVKFEVDEGVLIKQSRTIANLVEMECTMSNMPLPTVNSTTLAKVIEYCQKHAGADTDLTAWDADFIDVHRTSLYALLMAANYLDIKGLLDLSCQKVADMIKGKSPEEIRRTFDIKNDFTPEEEEEIREENPWAFELEEKVKH